MRYHAFCGGRARGPREPVRVFKNPRARRPAAPITLLTDAPGALTSAAATRPNKTQALWMPAAGGCPIGKMGVELAPVGSREEASAYEAPAPPKSFLDSVLTLLCKCCACKRRDWLPLPTDDYEAPPKRGRRRIQDRCRFSDQKPGHSIHATLREEAKSPLRVGRAGGALKLSPTVELFVYDDEDGPSSRKGLAPGSVRENRDKVRALRSVAGADWAHLDDAAAARILGEQHRKATGPAFRWHTAPPPPPPA